MRNKFNNFLLGALWFTISTLGTCFWFNTHYGFNIFSDAHWKHLAYMQATQNPVKSSFYLSMIIAVVIVIGGMYLLLRPRLRKITLPIRDTSTPTPPTVTTPPSPEKPKNNISEDGLQRPARLNMGTHTMAPAPIIPTQSAPLPTPTTAPVQQPQPQIQLTPPSTDDLYAPQMQEIFESAGYKTLPAPRISGLQTSVLALGAHETLWIGATDVQTSTLATTTDVMAQVFKDTLEDIEIHINMFVLNASDAKSPLDANVLTFANLDELRQYMIAHPNPPIPPDEAENFDAFNSYISTVIDYLGTL